MHDAGIRRRARHLAAGVAVLVAVGCTSQPGDAGDGAAPSTSPTAAEPSDAAPPEPDQDGADQDGADQDGADETGGLDDCDDALLDELDGVVASQLEAFGDGDYELALTFASEGFRSQFDAEQLEEVIEEGFPVAARAVGHTSSGCQVQSAAPDHAAAAVMDVVVRTDDGSAQALRYLFSLDPDGWGIAGATPVDGSDGGIVTA